MRKLVFGDSDQVLHKLNCANTEHDSDKRLEISDFKSRKYYPCSENKGADQLRGYREADLHLCFCLCKKPGFAQRGSNYSLHM